MAQKRARKAQKRKQQVTEKRRAEALEAGLPARVARAAGLPVQHCYVSEALFEDGIGTVVIARGATSHLVTMGSFLVDVFCLGVKNVMFEQLDDDEFEFYMERTGDTQRMIPVDPAYARRLLRDAAAWSASFGFAPHRDFPVVERLFGEVNADDCDAVFQFGREGKPHYVAGPYDTPALVRQRTAQLQRHLGEDARKAG
ncbi:hypothetical protein [Bradyrhizobium sp.]|uniref:hypothetical protein n=1 Tax=Bradyrhizobium sp. TaxID=376 RepID=UPI0040381B92